MRLFVGFWKRELFITTKVTKKKFNRLIVDLVICEILETMMNYFYHKITKKSKGTKERKNYYPLLDLLEVWACPYVKTSGQVVRCNLCSTMLHRGFPLPPFMRDFGN
jgi:hypothetical protein